MTLGIVLSDESRHAEGEDTGLDYGASSCSAD